MSAIYDFFNVFNVGSILLIILSTILLAAGLYWLVTDYLSVTSPKAKKAVLALKNTKTGFADAMTTMLANRIVKLIHMDENRQSVMQRKLYSAEIHYTPEFYAAKAISSGVLVALLAVPMYFIMPLVSILCIILGIAIYFRYFEKLNVIIREKSEKIDSELVQFANTIKQQLVNSRDVMRIFQSYRSVCGEEFLHELDITIADMRTGNYETALRNLESRIPSVGLSEIIHGLLAVMRGDDQKSYFEMLAHDLSVEDKERLKRAALKRPDKLKPAIILLMGSFLMMYIYVIGYQVVEQLTTMF